MKGCRFLLMEQAERVRGQDKGRTGVAVGANVRRARERLGVDLASLASRLAGLKWPIAKSALSRLENGQRRVDVDDLMALSVALYTSPVELLLGDMDHFTNPTATPDGMNALEAWAWAAGEVELDAGELVDWWRVRLEGLHLQLEGQQAQLDKQARLQPGGDARTRRWMHERMRETQAEIEQAIERIRVLAGEGEVAGIMWDSIPNDPTVAIHFGDDDGGQHDAH